MTHTFTKPKSNQRSTTSREASTAGRLRPNAVTAEVDFWVGPSTYVISDFRTNQELTPPVLASHSLLRLPYVIETSGLVALWLPSYFWYSHGLRI